MNYSIHNTKLALTLSTLQKKEWNLFDQWLTSPIHCTSKNLKIFYRNIRKLKEKKLPLKKLSLLVGIMKVTPSNLKLSSTEERMVANLMYQLNLQLKDFLVWRHIQTKEKIKHKLIVDELFERKSFELVHQELNKLEKSIETPGYRNPIFFENSIFLHRTRFYLDIIQSNRTPNKNLQRLLDSIRKFALSELLLYYNAAKNREGILNVRYELPMLNPILQLLEDNTDIEEPYLLIYYHMLKSFLVENPDPHYKVIKECLFEYKSSFNEIDLRQILNFLINRYSRKIKDGATDYILEKNELYHFGLQYKVWTTGINFSPHIYIQIIKNALRLKQFDWVENFMKEYVSFVTKRWQEDTKNYGKALIFFDQNRYHEAQDIVVRFAGAQDFVYFLDYRILSLKIFYETLPLSPSSLEKSPIYHLLEAMRQYLSSARNRHMSEYARETYTNFVKCFKKLWRRTEKLVYKDQLTNKEITQVIDDFMVISPIKERDWLIRKTRTLLELNQK